MRLPLKKAKRDVAAFYSDLFVVKYRIDCPTFFGESGSHIYRDVELACLGSPLFLYIERPKSAGMADTQAE